MHIIIILTFLILFDPELQVINAEPVIKNKLNDLLGELKKFKDQAILVIEYKKIDSPRSMQKIFYSSLKLIANDSDIYKVFRSMHQSVTIKMRYFLSKDWILKTFVEHSIKIFECLYRRK